MSNKKIVICDLDHEDVETERAVLEAAGYEFDCFSDGVMLAEVGIIRFLFFITTFEL